MQRGLSEFKEGMVLTGKVEVIHFHHGIKLALEASSKGAHMHSLPGMLWHDLAKGLRCGTLSGMINVIVLQ